MDVHTQAEIVSTRWRGAYQIPKHSVVSKGWDGILGVVAIVVLYSINTEKVNVLYLARSCRETGSLPKQTKEWGVKKQADVLLL